ncbi:MAG: hypothetical protein K2R93_13760 [Gemmatimonadaceae bacterium]|nr:hypothetical protein [Gemmatimonadaceae bacterium]
MSSTLERLTTAVADRYRVERELGAGGMATVYLAHDLRHERDVAIKVLHPDLGAALGAERFLSEIKTTAKLQHPHILPVWRRDSKALFYPEGDAIVEVSLAFTPDPVITGTRAVTQGVLASDDRLHAAFDVGPNGDIIGIRRVREPRLIVVRNFATEVRRALRGNGS